MDYVRASNGEQVRARLVLAGVLLAFAFLGCVLWRIQVLNSTSYRSSLDRQSMRRVRLPGSRGRILDRNGVCLADNRPSYCLAVYIEELRRPGPWSNTVSAVEEVIEGLAPILARNVEVTRDDIASHIYRRLPLPFVAWRDLDPAALARWAESRREFAGVDVYAEPVRYYPRGNLGAHVLGYVGRADRKLNPDEPYHFYLPEMEGKYGLEKTLDPLLAGEAGGRLIRVDASGYRHSEEGRRPAKSGQDVRLAMDVGLQRTAEELLQGERGAVVVMDCRNGDVLALASSPAFNGNSFSPSISREELDRLNSVQGTFVNRAVTAGYPPGSTFKVLVALAALANGRADGATEFNCPGYFMLGGISFGCWRRSGHGKIAMVKAIEQSCNAYFCQLGLQCGYERIYHMAEAAGFGHPTGIELAGEIGGLLPDRDWNLRKLKVGWRGGDTCNVSIGQGALLVTPLQMTVFLAAVANGGKVMRPRLVLDGDPRGEIVQRVDWPPEALRVVRQGMHDVVQAANGTGKRARLAGVTLGGKTGSAEYGPPHKRKKHAWMMAYGPWEDPRYAAVIVIEDGVSGGITTAPRMRRLMGVLFGVPEVPEPGDGGQPT